MTLELHATPAEVMRAVEALQEFAQAQGLPDKTVFNLALALEECASNVVNHGLKRDASRTFHVRFGREGDAFIIELRDRGPEFDPTTTARKAQAEDGDPPGGWGTELVRRKMDEIRYRREAGENILRLTKRLSPSAGSK